MLHEILLSLSGHPSPLITNSTTHRSTTALSPAETALLSSIAHISKLHRSLLTQTITVAATHPSSICRAVATCIRTTHLAAFQQTILAVEDDILRRDAGSVGAYNIVPLTSVVGRFTAWTRRLEWLESIMNLIMGVKGKECSGAVLIGRLRGDIQTGYTDIETVARSLAGAAETAWLKQVAGWILYGHLPAFGREDFFIQVVHGEFEDFESKPDLLPAFVPVSTAGSLLFIGRSLNQIQRKGASETATTPQLSLISSHLKQLSSLTHPINASNFAQVVASIRLSLSQTRLQTLLPLSRVVESLSLLRNFFLLGRGEFAISLITEADEKIRSRWRRADNLGHEKREGLGNIVVKKGEISAVLTRTWAAMAALQGRNADQDEDEQLDLARSLIQLTTVKSNATPGKETALSVANPFRSLLLSVPVFLTLNVSSPLDLFLTPADVQCYSSINAYLLSIHRAHFRLTDLWKITSLRRDHPAPPAPPFGSSGSGRVKTRVLRERVKLRSQAMRNVWATSSAAVFFLAETEAYLQGEVVQGTWDGFRRWVTGEDEPTSREPERKTEEINQVEDIWLEMSHETESHGAKGRAAGKKENTSRHTQHDPQSLALAHQEYLRALTSRLLLTDSGYMAALYTLLTRIDQLVALVHRLHAIWGSLDLEADEGVVDAFSDFVKEEIDVRVQLESSVGLVKQSIEGLVGILRSLDQEPVLDLRMGIRELDLGRAGGDEEIRYVPVQIGGVDRLLMKLDFGGWFWDGRMEGILRS